MNNKELETLAKNITKYTHDVDTPEGQAYVEMILVHLKRVQSEAAAQRTDIEILESRIFGLMGAMRPLLDEWSQLRTLSSTEYKDQMREQNDLKRNEYEE